MGREKEGQQDQVTDHIPKNDETFLTETAGKCDRGLQTEWREYEPVGCVLSVCVGGPELVLTRIEETLV